MPRGFRTCSEIHFCVRLACRAVKVPPKVALHPKLIWIAIYPVLPVGEGVGLPVISSARRGEGRNRFTAPSSLINIPTYLLR